MTDERVTEELRTEELPSAQGFRPPWLALAGVLATIVAATTLVIGIGDSIGDDRPPDRLLPLEAAAPPLTPTPTPAPTPAETLESDPEEYPTETLEGSEPDLYKALLRLRSAVDDGVEEGDVRDDVGTDLTNVIERILDRPRSSDEGHRDDVAYLHHKIAIREREGGIDDDRADQFHWILSRAID